MKTLRNKIIATGKEIEEDGYKHLFESKGKVIFGKGCDRKVYQRLIGKTERYKFINSYKSNG